MHLSESTDSHLLLVHHRLRVVETSRKPPTASQMQTEISRLEQQLKVLEVGVQNVNRDTADRVKLSGELVRSRLYNIRGAIEIYEGIVAVFSREMERLALQVDSDNFISLC